MLYVAAVDAAPAPETASAITHASRMVHRNFMASPSCLPVVSWCYGGRNEPDSVLLYSHGRGLTQAVAVRNLRIELDRLAGRSVRDAPAGADCPVGVDRRVGEAVDVRRGEDLLGRAVA